jgi:regulator of sirC expression with transglutaminase-like and TPR domain
MAWFPEEDECVSAVRIDETPSPAELDLLLRLLDDETAEVRKHVSERLTKTSGDLSDWLAARDKPLGAKDKALLSALLAPARRATLERDWQAPSTGLAALDDDWDSCEALLRQISDFLHDGVSVRQSLSDALDLLAEEAEANESLTPLKLRKFLFDGGRFKGNSGHYDDPRNSDLAWCIAEGTSNPIGLCLIFLLVARRLDIEVQPINNPGHFLCRIHEDGYPIIIDCFNAGAIHLQMTLLEDPDLTKRQRDIYLSTAPAGDVVIRVLNNLINALDQAMRPEDAGTIRAIRKSLSDGIDDEDLPF